ncbi:hypothetical protein [uncultured Ruminococcus sp.]|uniref:hypothetical protein n=1 Tax=uncultured Ruminococcus sp. TaxID=165186 RepID=UPI0025F65090|nr:hypothetical protein [uncultured Ruminococcus sp.]
MKKVLISAAAALMAVLAVSCSAAESSPANETTTPTAEVVTYAEKTAENTTAATADSSQPLMVAIPDSVLESDGIIAPMKAGELVEKLAKLKAYMTLDEIIALFGKEPFMVKESNENIFKYYSGDVTITLWGTHLFQAIVECKGSALPVDLGLDLSKQ